MPNSINRNKLIFLLSFVVLALALIAFVSHKPFTEQEYRREADKIAKQQDWQALEVLAREWLRQFPQSDMSYTALGDSLRMRGSYAAAAEAYAQAIKITPDNPEIWALHGVMMLELSNFEQAASSCQSSITINPESAQTWYCLALAAAELNQAEPSLFALSKLAVLNPSLHETARKILLTHTCKKSQNNLPAQLCTDSARS